jgi:hypothetical protein
MRLVGASRLDRCQGGGLDTSLVKKGRIITSRATVGWFLAQAKFDILEIEIRGKTPRKEYELKIQWRQNFAGWESLVRSITSGSVIIKSTFEF